MKVLLVEDSPLIRDRIADMIGGVAGVEIVGQVAGPAAAVYLVATTHPDVVVLDLQLSGGSGLGVLRELRDLAPDIIVMVLTNYAIPEFRRKCLAAGARYFFDKTTEFTGVRDALAQLVGAK